MSGGGNPVGLRAAGWGGKTLGTVTAIQFCWRKRNSFTVLARADGNFNDGVTDLCGRFSLRENILGWAR